MFLPSALHGNFLDPSCTSVSHLARYDFQGLPSVSASGCGHPALQHSSPVLFGLPSGSPWTTRLTLTSCSPVLWTCSSQRSRGVRSPRSGENALLFPLSLGFFMAPAVAGQPPLSGSDSHWTGSTFHLPAVSFLQFLFSGWLHWP